MRTPEGFKEERRYDVGASATWAVPVVLPDGLLVREAGAVVKLTWAAGG